MAYTYIILLVILNLAAHGVSLSIRCGLCSTVSCGEPASNCRFGITRDPCGCCDYCVSGPGKECDQVGLCGLGLECVKSFPIPYICVAKHWKEYKLPTRPLWDDAKSQWEEYKLPTIPLWVFGGFVNLGL